VTDHSPAWLFAALRDLGGQVKARDARLAAVDAEMRQLADAMGRLAQAAEVAAGACDRLAETLERTSR
jgi:ABC-type Fe3+-hydroxamate transport system substrate-binding protein